MLDILQRDKSGEPVSLDEADYSMIKKIIRRTKILVQQMNTQVLDVEGAREYFAKITSTPQNPTLNLNTPFFTDFGKNIRVGDNVFINFGCVFMDRGGITIGNDVFIAPQVKLITENHGLQPAERRTLVSKPITICDNVWIGTGAIVLGGVTIGKNAVVGAGSVVTHDVAENTVVAGNPAKVINAISENSKK